jgi:hypothetical protein
MPVTPDSGGRGDATRLLVQFGSSVALHWAVDWARATHAAAGGGAAGTAAGTAQSELEHGLPGKWLLKVLQWALLQYTIGGL